jgi:hypothetical protein
MTSNFRNLWTVLRDGKPVMTRNKVVTNPTRREARNMARKMGGQAVRLAVVKSKNRVLITEFA